MSNESCTDIRYSSSEHSHTLTSLQLVIRKVHHKSCLDKRQRFDGFKARKVFLKFNQQIVFLMQRTNVSHCLQSWHIHFARYFNLTGKQGSKPGQKLFYIYSFAIALTRLLSVKGLGQVSNVDFKTLCCSFCIWPVKECWPAW